MYFKKVYLVQALGFKTFAPKNFINNLYKNFNIILLNVRFKMYILIVFFPLVECS